MEALGPWHILIVAAVFVVLFGAKRLPDAARSLGKSAKILKSELRDGADTKPETPVVVEPTPVVVERTPVVVEPSPVLVAPDKIETHR